LFGEFEDKQIMTASQRVIVNTIAQYTRTIINVCLSLYSTRLILSILGQTDYGIYSVVAGVVAMLSFVTSALTTTTQRFLSFHHGKKDPDKIKLFFGNSLLLHIFIGSAIALILASIGKWVTHEFLNIDPARQTAALYVYISAVAMLLLTFINAPIRALFVARENIVYTSIIDVVDGVLRLVIAIILSHINCDQLITYSSLLVGISVINLLAFAIYAHRKYPEFHMPKIKEFNKTYITDLSNFAGWTIYSAGCIIARNQGIAVVLNIVYGTIINSAYGIAQQVSGAVQFVSTSILQAMNPQIMKAEGAGERAKMLRLCEYESKYAFLLLSMVAIPLIAEMDTILQIWLNEVPKYAVMFCRFILIAALCDQITVGLTSANQAIGKIKTYSLIFYTLKLLVIFIGWICLRNGLPVVSIMWCYVIIEFATSLVRLPLMKKIADINIIEFSRAVFARIIVPCISMSLVCYMLVMHTNMQYRIILTVITSFSVGVITIWFTSLKKEEKTYIKTLISKKKL
jgi:O-antigen/teichoic acid export membrane protein